MTCGDSMRLIEVSSIPENSGLGGPAAWREGSVAKGKMNVTAGIEVETPVSCRVATSRAGDLLTFGIHHEATVKP
jgi:hypothetical protein